jgi:hypothetical protein
VGGAVFNLMDPAGAEAEFESISGERVSTSKDSRAVVVSNVDASDYKTAWRKGLVATQQALDVFSARGLADLHLQEPRYDHLAVMAKTGARFYVWSASRP